MDIKLINVTIYGGHMKTYPNLHEDSTPSLNPSFTWKLHARFPYGLQFTIIEESTSNSTYTNPIWIFFPNKHKLHMERILQSPYCFCPSLVLRCTPTMLPLPLRSSSVWVCLIDPLIMSFTSKMTSHRPHFVGIFSMDATANKSIYPTNNGPRH